MKNREKLKSTDVINLTKQLRSGQTPRCPQCGKGVISTTHDPKISHFFSCDKCEFMINID